jgi:hypothetical protein
LAGCDHAPVTTVAIVNGYGPNAPHSLVIYRASWQAVSFHDAVLPGSSSEPQTTLAASATTAYVVLAPGWDPTTGTPPTSFVILQSRQGFEVHLDTTLRIAVDDSTFIGNCAAGSVLPQEQADFITQLVFPTELGPFSYDAATCTTTPKGGSRAP